MFIKGLSLRSQTSLMLSLFTLQPRIANCDIHSCLFGLENSAVGLDFNVKGNLDAVKLLIVSLECFEFIAHPICLLINNLSIVQSIKKIIHRLMIALVIVEVRSCNS